MPDHLSEAQIARYRGRQLAPEELLRVDDHISQCADCRERLASSSELRAALQRGDARLQPGQARDAMAAPQRATSRRSSLQDMSVATPQAPSQGEHLTYEQLEAFVDSKMCEADRGLAQAHLESCPSCFEDVRDLETFRVELAGSKGPSKESQWPAFVARWLSGRRIALAVAMAAVIVFAVEVGRRQMAPPHGVPSKGTTISSATGIEALLARYTLLKEERAALLDAISQRRIETPVVLAGLRGRKETLLGPTPGRARFEVLQPLGEVVLDVRPLFRWQPLPGAARYSVAIFDLNLNPVQSSPALGTTQWSPSQPLQRGQTYLWQVTAKLSNGQRVSSPRPPSPEARFRVLDQTKADELLQFQEAHPAAHLALGILYARAGLLEQGEHELGQLAKNDPDYDLAQKLLKSIQEIRNPAR